MIKSKENLMLVIFNIFLPLFYRETESRYQCNGQYIRGICHLSILDMQEIFQTVANSFSKAFKLLTT